MNRIPYIVAAVLGLTAIIGVSLWLGGYPPVDPDPVKQTSVLRAVVTFPLFWVGLGLIFTVAVALAKRASFSGGKSDALPTTAIVTMALMALVMQVVVPLKLYGVIGGDGVRAVILGGLVIFFLMVGNYIVTVPPGSRMGFRNRWTLSDDSVWIRTHRYFGNRLIAVTLLVGPAALAFSPDSAQYYLIGAVLLLKATTLLHARGLAQQVAFETQGSLAS